MPLNPDPGRDLRGDLEVMMDCENSTVGRRRARV